MLRADFERKPYAIGHEFKCQQHACLNEYIQTSDYCSICYDEIVFQTSIVRHWHNKDILMDCVRKIPTQNKIQSKLHQAPI